MFHGQTQKVNISQVLGGRQVGGNSGSQQGKIILPKLMPWSGEEAREENAGGLRRSWPTRIFGASEDAQKAVFDQWAGGPTMTRKAGPKKSPGGGGVRMGWIAERDQNVNVEQMDHFRRGWMAR